ncbi:MAG: DegT/DnrJ/EryC1/StrS family aminotransferase [Candidatus Omnitrophota bacterium]|nr:MAG: DegT/DnrJ/EryC1/StrS family aminotransferase [Candidatus Omnitrophota bacterium]
MNIPILDLKRQFRQIKSEVDKNVREVLASGSYILGKNVSAFEEEFAEYCRGKYAIGVASGTDALKIALRACGIGKEDEVITTPFTFVATTEAIHSVGARIVFADIDMDSYTIDPQEIEKKITKKTKAIICVHLYGQPCDMRTLRGLSRKYNLKLIEDCAQAAGAEYKGKRVAVFGDVGCFSFFPSKNLGAFGDGGIIVTNNKQIAENARVFRVYGSRNKYEHIVHGLNSRLDELQAAILRVKLRYLDQWNEARRKNTACYNKKFCALEERGLVITPKEQKGTKHVYHLYVLRAKQRDALMDFLKTRGVGTAYHYPIPLHLQEVYKCMEHQEGDFPKSELAAGEILSLPLFPELKKKEIDYIADCVYQFYRNRK